MLMRKWRNMTLNLTISYQWLKIWCIRIKIPHWKRWNHQSPRLWNIIYSSGSLHGFYIIWSVLRPHQVVACFHQWWCWRRWTLEKHQVKIPNQLFQFRSINILKPKTDYQVGNFATKSCTAPGILSHQTVLMAFLEILFWKLPSQPPKTTLLIPKIKTSQSNTYDHGGQLPPMHVTHLALIYI